MFSVPHRSHSLPYRILSLNTGLDPRLFALPNEVADCAAPTITMHSFTQDSHFCKLRECADGCVGMYALVWKTLAKDKRSLLRCLFLCCGHYTNRCARGLIGSMDVMYIDFVDDWLCLFFSPRGFLPSLHGMCSATFLCLVEIYVSDNISSITRISLTIVPNISLLVIVRWAIREFAVAIVAVNSASLRPMFHRSFWSPRNTPGRCRPANIQAAAVRQRLDAQIDVEKTGELRPVGTSSVKMEPRCQRSYMETDQTLRDTSSSTRISVQRGEYASP